MSKVTPVTFRAGLAPIVEVAADRRSCLERGRFGRGDVGGVAVELVAFDEEEKGHRARTDGLEDGKTFRTEEPADGRDGGGRGGNGGGKGAMGSAGEEAGCVNAELVAKETDADTGSGSDSGTAGLAV